MIFFSAVSIKSAGKVSPADFTDTADPVRFANRNQHNSEFYCTSEIEMANLFIDHSFVV